MELSVTIKEVVIVNAYELEEFYKHHYPNLSKTDILADNEWNIDSIYDRSVNDFENPKSDLIREGKQGKFKIRDILEALYLDRHIEKGSYLIQT